MDKARQNFLLEDTSAFHNFYQQLFEQSPTGFIISNFQTGELIDINEAVAEILGRSVAETRGLTYWDVTPPEYADREKEVRQLLASVGRYGPYVKEYIHKDGHRVKVRLNGRLIDRDDTKYILSSVEDISLQVRTEAENNRLGRILEESMNEIYIFDARTYHFVQANKGALRNMGYSMAEMRELTAYAIKPDFTRETFEATVAPLKSGAQRFLTFETTHQRKDGSRYPVEVRLQLFTEEDQPLFVAIINDSSKRKSAEAAVRLLNENLEQRVVERTEQLDRANKQLQTALHELQDTQEHLIESEKMASLGGLVAGVAHEINTPVGVAVTAASYIDDIVRTLERRYRDGSMKRSDLQDFLAQCGETNQMVLSNVRRASDLVRGFKQVAVDQTSEAKREFDLRGYLDEVVTSLQPKLKQGNHRVEIQCPEGIIIDSYPGAISQVVTNLLTNSVKHGFDGVEGGTITINAEQNETDVVICFQDNGVGMEPTVRERIFEPFFTTRRGDGGSGLGLHITYNLVTQKLGGRIDCTSVGGNGTTFRILIPRTEDVHHG